MTASTGSGTATRTAEVAIVSTFDRRHRKGRVRVRKFLLACGVAYSLSYVIANDVVAAAWYDGYNRVDQAISELSAKGASPRPFLVAMLPVWTALMIAFGIGVWKSAHGRRGLRVAGALLVAHGVVAVSWLWFPMTARADMVGRGTGANDAGHLVLTALTLVFILSELGFAAASLGRRFRLYSLVTAVIVLAFGSLVGTQSPNLQDGKPTAWMGLFERVCVGAWLLWLVVLAVTLTRAHDYDMRVETAPPGAA
jgi:hypothetical protein